MGFKLRATGSSPPIDMDTVRRALLLLVDPDEYVFLQSLNHNASVCLHGGDRQAIESWVVANSSARGLYFGINPIVKIDRSSRVGDVTRRRWILIDIDRNKALQPDDPATENEHEDAMELTFEVQSYLSDIGFPAPIQVDSGNGYHLYYRVDLPNDDASRDLVRDFLKLLDNTFSCEKGKIGSECFDSRRISRIPGTWSRRGTASKDRPYRQSRIVYSPIDGGIVPTELLMKVVADDARHKESKESQGQLVADEPDVIPIESTSAEPRPGFKMKAGGSDSSAYGKAALDRECAKIAGCPKGGRNNQLFKSAAALYELVASGTLDEMTVRNELFCAAVNAGMDLDKDAGGDRGINATIDSGKKHGLEKPRSAPEGKNQKKNGKASGQQQPIQAKQKLDPNERVVDFANEIKPAKITWLWSGVLPLGMLTTFAGSTGQGKTMVLTDIAARVTRGDVWPNGVSGNQAGGVLYISGEDTPKHTLVPRLMAAGGVLENVCYLNPKHLGKFTLRKEDHDILDKALDELAERVPPMLICVDPPTSFLAGTDDNKNAELREILTPLGEFAERRNVAMVFISHLNKGGAGKVDALMRIIGSVAWAAAVRAAYMFCQDPDEEGRSLFLCGKINVAKKPKGLAYRIDEVELPGLGMHPKITWLGEVDTTANDAIAGQPKAKSSCQNAAEWLTERFREHLEWSSKDLFAEAKNNGVAESSIWKAKKLLDLPPCRKTILPNGTIAWCWWVPENWSGFNIEEPAVEEKPREF